MGNHLLFLLFEDQVLIFEYILGVILGDNLWYMPCCIFAEIIYFYQMKYAKSERKFVCSSILCVIFGCILVNINWLNILCINIAFVVQGYMLIGLAFKKFEQKIKTMNLKVIVCIGCVVYISLAIYSLYIYHGYFMDVHK